MNKKDVKKRKVEEKKKLKHQKIKAKHAKKKRKVELKASRNKAKKVEKQKRKSEKKGKGFLLSTWIIAMFLGNILFVAFFSYQVAIKQPLGIPDALTYFLIFLGVVNVLSAYLLFTYKRMGLYLFALSSIAMGLVNHFQFGNTPFGIAGIIPPLITYGLMFTRWKNFK